MAVGTDSLIEIVFNMSYQNNQVLNVWQYRVGATPGVPTLVQMLEAYWNNVKANYRAIYSSNAGNLFLTLRGREMNNPTGDYAEYDIPLADQTGTHAPGTPTEQMPLFVAAAVRLVVGTRATRPGQKRFAPVQESDVQNGVLQASLKTPLNTLMAQMVADMTLGAPAALTILHPIVCRKDAAGYVTASQAPTGFLIANQVSTQNTRKLGRGA